MSTVDWRVKSAMQATQAGNVGVVRREESSSSSTPPDANSREEQCEAGRTREAGDRPAILPLAHGRSIKVERASEDRLVLEGPDGTVELLVRLTSDGVQLSFGTASLVLATEADVRIRCARFDVQARSEVSLRSGGAIVQEAEADVTVNGERILLNC